VSLHKSERTRYLVVGGPEAPSHILIIQDLHFECEVLFEILDYHNEERQLNAERLRGVGRASHVGRAHVG
jgi:hypothetical protein